MYGEWWARLKTRRTCQHDWVLESRHEVPDIDKLEAAVFQGGIIDCDRRKSAVLRYRCRLCGKREHIQDYDYPERL